MKFSSNHLLQPIWRIPPKVRVLARKSNQSPESGGHAEASHADERSEEDTDDRVEQQRDAIIPRFRTGANIFLSLAALACFCRCP